MRFIFEFPYTIREEPPPTRPTELINFAPRPTKKTATFMVEAETAEAADVIFMRHFRRALGNRPEDVVTVMDSSGRPIDVREPDTPAREP